MRKNGINVLAMLVAAAVMIFNDIAAGNQQRRDEVSKGAMVSIKGGCFDMGDAFSDRGAGERPVHRVCLDDFRMDRHEVTQTEYERVMGKNPSGHVNCPDCPVEQVTWDEAKEYCEKVGKRLPAEAEWEYAAREGGKNVKYGTGKDEVDCATANLYGCGGETKPVGSYASNALGIHDMAGNVWEWTADWYGEDYYKTSPEHNPKGPLKGRYRVARGGSWNDESRALRAARPGFMMPGIQNDELGFRCSR